MIVLQRYAENNNKTTKHTNLKYVNNITAILAYLFNSCVNIFSKRIATSATKCREAFAYRCFRLWQFFLNCHYIATKAAENGLYCHSPMLLLFVLFVRFEKFVFLNIM